MINLANTEAPHICEINYFLSSFEFHSSGSSMANQKFVVFPRVFFSN